MKHNESLVGQKMCVLLETQLSLRTWEGRTMADAPEVDQTFVVTMNREIYDPAFVNAVVKKAGDYGLEGTECPEGGR